MFKVDTVVLSEWLKKYGLNIEEISIPDTVRVTYDGYGDEGSLLDIMAFLKGEVTDAADFDWLEDLCYEYLPNGWGDSEGSYGTIELDFTDCLMAVYHTWRVDDGYEPERDDEDYDRYDHLVDGESEAKYIHLT